MKIELDLMDNGIPYIQQMEAVDKYIKENTIRIERREWLGMEVSAFPIVTETKKDTGEKIKTQHRNFYVNCRKTKGGTYKFKVWQAI